MTIKLHLMAGAALLALAACGGEAQGPRDEGAIESAEADAAEATPTTSGGELEEANPTAEDVDPSIWPQLRSPLPENSEIEAEIERLLGAMTTEQKVGQVIQGDIASLTPDDVAEYHLGSVLNGGNSAPGGDNRTTPQAWLDLADQFWDASMGEGGTGIPVIWGTDAVHGHSNIVGATIFPHNIGLGAAHDPDLIRRIGEVTAREIAITGLDWTFAPTVAVPQDDRWGRAYEGYSEDPELVAAYAGEMVRGLQGEPGTDGFLGEGRVVATAKHFLGDGGTRGGVDQGETIATEEELRDIHAAGYTTAIEAGLQGAMASFSSWRGAKMHGSRALLTNVLRDQMGFDGLVVGDWNGHAQVAGCTPTDCAQAINAGLDLYMAPDSWRGLYDTLLAQVEDGTVSMERLDEAVARVLRVKLRADLPNKGRPSSRPLAGQFELLGSDDHRAVAREAVRKSLVLIKNDGVLPIAPGANVLIAGDGASDITKQMGGWTLTWQGDGNTSEDFPNGETIYEGIERAVSAAGGQVTLSEDGSFDEAPDVAIVIFGEPSYAEFRGDRPDVDFPDDGPLELLRALQEDGVPVVSVFLSGRPLWANPEINASNAFVAAWQPGSEGGGIADVLVADASGAAAYDFEGTLSFSWPKRPDQARLNVGDEDYDPLFALGYGLTYAEGGEVATLDEDFEAASGDANVLIADGDVGGARRMFLRTSGEDRLVSEPTVSTGDGAVTLSRTDRDAQEDSIRLAFQSPGSFVVEGDTTDLRREAGGDVGLQLDYRFDEAPEGVVTYGVGQAVFPLTTAEPGSWQSVNVRLACFAEAGADLSATTAALVIAADGPATMTISDARLVPGEAGSACPAR